MAGVPIYFDNGYKITRGFFLPTLHFSLSEALALVMSSGILAQYRGTPFSEAASSAITKILAVLPPEIRESSTEIAEKVLYNAQPIVDYSKHKDIFARLEEARRAKKRVKMEYYTLERDAITKRLVDPYGLINRLNTWYLVAYCHWRKEIKMFRIDRIRKLEVTSQTFEIPLDFSLEDYMGDAWQVIRGESHLVKIKFTCNAAKRVVEDRWHPSQILEIHKDGSVIMTVLVSGLSEIASWVLSFGGEAEVLEPKELREKIRKSVSSLSRIYK